MRKVLASLIAVLILVAPAAARAQDGTTVAHQAFIVDFDTGTVLLEKNAQERMPTSSMSKVMTMYMVFEALKEGKLSLEQTLPVSEKAWKTQGSKMFVHVGDMVKVDDLIRGVIIQSGNDATIVLAEGVAGTEEAFADMMNERLKDLGMNDSHFTNASGWPDPEHYSTAADLAKLGVALVRDFPEYYYYYSEKEFTYNNIKQGNRNPLLYRNIGADGIKTGHTEDAGYGLMASGIMNGRRVVMVLNGLKDMQERADESARLLEWALRNFQNIGVYKPGDIVDQAQVVLGQSPTVPLTVEKSILITLPIAVRRDLGVEATINQPVKAPVKKGQVIGTLKVSAPRVSTQEVPLVAAADVPAKGFFGRAVENAKLLISGGKAGSVQPVPAVTQPAAEPAATMPPAPAPVIAPAEPAIAPAPAETGGPPAIDLPSDAAAPAAPPPQPETPSMDE